MVEKIKILAISYAYIPWLAPRSLQVLRLMNYLAAKDCEITLFHKLCQGQNVKLDLSLLEKSDQRVKTVEIDESNSFFNRFLKKYFYRFIALPDSANLWAINVFKQIKNEIDSFDIIITFSSPVSDHLVGLLVKNRYPDIPWLAFFSDPYVDNPYLTKGKIRIYFDKTIENAIINKSQATVFVNEATKNAALRRYPFDKSLKDKISVIPHSFDRNAYPPVGGDVEKEKLLICYIGDFYGERNPEWFFKALVLARKRNPFLDGAVELQIYGSRYHGLDYLLEKYDLHHIVKHMGYVGYEESLKIMKLADLLLVIDAPAKENLFLTSKIIDYLGAKTRILAITPSNGPTYDLMKELGWPSYSHEDVSGIADQIETYLNMKKNNALTGDICDNIYNRYKIEAVGKEYLELIRSLIGNK